SCCSRNAARPTARISAPAHPSATATLGSSLQRLRFSGSLCSATPRRRLAHGPGELSTPAPRGFDEPPSGQPLGGGPGTPAGDPGAGGGSVRRARARSLDRGLRVPLVRFLHEPIDLALRLVLSTAVALLDLPGQDLGVAVDLIEVVVGELTPLFADVALQLLPLSLEGFLVHRPLPPSSGVDGRIDAGAVPSENDALSPRKAARPL